MRDTVIVALLFFMTSIDSILLIFSAVRIKWHPNPQKARLLIFCTLCAAHPLYSFVVDTFFRLPGLRLVSAFIIVFFAFRLAGEPPIEFRSAASPKRTAITIIGTTVWLDALTSIDTSVLVSAASPSLLITVVGNVAAMILLVSFAPHLYRWASETPWLQIGIASFMSMSAVLQLRGETLLGGLAANSVLLPAGGLVLALTAFHGWRRQLH